MLIGFDRGATDKYILGNTEIGGFGLFLRNASLIVATTPTTVGVFEYADWEARKTGRVILEITNLGYTASVGSKILLKQNNGVSYIGNSGGMAGERTFIDRIGEFEGDTRVYDGELGILKVFNRPFADDTERLIEYNKVASIYVPD